MADPLATISEIPVKIIIEPTENIPLHQRLAPKIAELHLLGMSLRAISRSLEVNRQTILRALNHLRKGGK